MEYEGLEGGGVTQSIRILEREDLRRNPRLGIQRAVREPIKELIILP